jgi:ketosteroid isomerase-like protein
MSEENVEMVRRAIEAATRQPAPDQRTVDELFHPAHEFHSLIGEMEGGDARGATGLRQLRQRMSAAGEWSIKIEDVREGHDGRVVVLMRTLLHSKLGDVPVAQQRATVASLRDGKIIRTDIYATWDEGRQAVGLAR